MTMPDLQPYPWNSFIWSKLWEIPSMSWLEKRLFLWVSPLFLFVKPQRKINSLKKQKLWNLMQTVIFRAWLYTKLLTHFSESWYKIEPGDWAVHPRSLNSTDVELILRLYNKGLGTCTFIPLSDRCIFTMPVREQRSPTASSPIIIHEYASSESTTSPRISYAALSSPDYPLLGTDLAGDLE